MAPRATGPAAPLSETPMVAIPMTPGSNTPGIVTIGPTGIVTTGIVGIVGSDGMVSSRGWGGTGIGAAEAVVVSDGCAGKHAGDGQAEGGGGDGAEVAASGGVHGGAPWLAVAHPGGASLVAMGESPCGRFRTQTAI